MTDGYFTGQLGFSGGSRTANLWIEGIQNTAAMNQQIKVSVDPDGPSGPAGFVLSDAVRVAIPLILILDSASMLTDHVEIGHWGADAGTGLTGYDTMTPPMVINTSSPDGTFIDVDPDRFKVRVSAFYENTNPAMIEDFQVSIGTEGSAADDDDPITLLETGDNTGIFESEFMLMMSPDLPSADNPDDDYDVYTQRTMPPARIPDDMPEDRTHRADVDGRLLVTYGAQKLSVPVCGRGSGDKRKLLNIQVFVFNEPLMDVNSNGTYDTGETFMDISAGATAFGTTGTWGAIWTDAQVNRQLDFLRAYTTSACVRITEVGPWLRPNPKGMLFWQPGAPPIPGTEGHFDDFPDDVNTNTPSRDEEVIQTHHRSAVNKDGTEDNDVLDIYFVAPFTAAGGALGSNFTPKFLAEQSPPGHPHLICQAHVSLEAATSYNDPTVSAHEALHQLTNHSDSPTPPYIFFPDLGSPPGDGTTWEKARRMTAATEGNARTTRTGLTDTGNKLLRAP